MSSLWNRSGTIERFGPDDLAARGAKAFFFQGGTTTPLTVYQDAGQSSAYQFPVLADANGRWPDIFVPYIISYDVRVTTAEDVQITFTLAIPNPDPVQQTVVIPPEKQVQTGMIHAELIDATKVGYVRLNGKTIGNGVSNATERAQDDTLALFTYLWNNLTQAIAPVSGGRGASAAADFSPGNKTIVLPDCTGAALVGLDTMGDVAKGRFTGLTFTAGSGSVPGSLLGSNSMTLAIVNLPAHQHTGTSDLGGAHTPTINSGTNSSTATSGFANADHTHAFGGNTGGVSADHTHVESTSNAPGVSVLAQAGILVNSGLTTTTTSGASNDHFHGFGGTTGGISANHQHAVTVSVVPDAVAAHTHGFTTSSVGSGTAFNNMGISRLVTWYIKL